MLLLGIYLFNAEKISDYFLSNLNPTFMPL